MTQPIRNGSVERPDLGRSTNDAKTLYLDLMKKSLLNSIYETPEDRPFRPRGSLWRNPRAYLWERIVKACDVRGLRIVRTTPYDLEAHKDGRCWPGIAHTMIGTKRLDNIRFCMETALADGVPGDIIEAGVWRGGATIFMRAVLKAHGVTDRRVWVADSFQGLPKPNEQSYPADSGDQHHLFEPLMVSLDDVKRNFQRYDLLDDRVVFLKGWFRETLPSAPIDRLSVVRLDGDMYESTIVALEALYPKLSPGGFVIVDDYGALPGCRQAVGDYHQAHGITDEIIPIDWTGVYWRRS
jgi:O-methyltransferase